jgi:hypothetical protein
MSVLAQNSRREFLATHRTSREPAADCRYYISATPKTSQVGLTGSAVLDKTLMHSSAAFTSALSAGSKERSDWARDMFFAMEFMLPNK